MGQGTAALAGLWRGPKRLAFVSCAGKIQTAQYFLSDATNNCFEQDTFFSQFPAHREPPGAEKADAGRKRKIPCEQPAGTGHAALVAQRRFAPVTGQRIRARWRARARQSGRLQKGGKRSGTAEAEFRRPGPLARRRLNAFVFGRGPARAKPGGTPGRGRFLHPFGRPCRCRPAAGMAANGHRRMKI